jgi:hypothetical protein
MDMREGSVLARSGTFGSLLRLLAEKMRRSLEFFANLRANGSDGQQPDDEFAWLEAYKAALLEFNERRASLAINVAMKAIDRRKRILGFNRRHAQEWDLLEHAASTLLTIRTHRVLPPPDNTQDAAAEEGQRAA